MNSRRRKQVDQVVRDREQSVRVVLDCDSHVCQREVREHDGLA
jgi:hypothetical protein